MDSVALDDVKTMLAGETVVLLPERALFWPSQRLLAIADVHFGKAASFRAKGVPVPRGTTTANLETLDRLLARHPVGQVIFLGDFLHARGAHAQQTLDAIRAWRRRHAALQLVLVRGNHDHHAGDPPADLRLIVVDEPYRLGPFAFCHHPQELDGTYVLAGHLHPVYRLAAGGDSLRLPCFLVSPRQAILPAFGAFTGGHPIRPESSDEIYLVTDDRVFALPSARLR